MTISLTNFNLVSSLFQDGFCDVLFPSKISHPLPSVFTVACSPPCHFIWVVQMRGKMGCACYAGQNYFASWCRAPLFLYPFCGHFCIGLSHGTVILISSPLEDISVKVIFCTLGVFRG